MIGCVKGMFWNCLNIFFLGVIVSSDEDINQTVSYHLVDGSEKMFRVTDNHTLIALESLDYELDGPLVEVRMIVMDDGQPPSRVRSTLLLFYINQICSSLII